MLRYRNLIFDHEEMKKFLSGDLTKSLNQILEKPSLEAPTTKIEYSIIDFLQELRVVLTRKIGLIHDIDRLCEIISTHIEPFDF